MSLSFSAAVDARQVDVAFEVASGQTLAVLGPNGSGKSTSLAVAAGLLQPDRGRVVLDGRVLTDVGPASHVQLPPHRRRTATLGQEPLLFPHLTALENVAFGPRSGGVPRERARTDAARWLEAVGVADLAGRRPSSLSGGEAQRVAVARALAAAPQLLLLDEPMAALDVEVQPAVRRVLHDVLAGQTTVLVTHDPLDALLLADVVVVLQDGAVVEEGPCRQVLARPRSAFAARLAGLNLVAGAWRDGGVETSEGRRVHGTVEGDRPPAGAPVLATFRPQAVAVYRTAPSGSPRNVLAVTVTDLEPRGDQVLVRAGDLSAAVTLEAVADLDLAPGAEVVFVVKATEVALYAL